MGTTGTEGGGQKEMEVAAGAAMAPLLVDLFLLMFLLMAVDQIIFFRKYKIPILVNLEASYDKKKKIFSIRGSNP
jgi:hypothetical protein